MVIAVLFFGPVFGLAALAGTAENDIIYLFMAIVAGALAWVIAERQTRRRTRYAVISQRVLKADARTGRRSGQYTLRPTSRVWMISGNSFVPQSRKLSAPGNRTPALIQAELQRMSMLPLGFAVGPTYQAAQAAKAINKRLRELRDELPAD